MSEQDEIDILRIGIASHHEALREAVDGARRAFTRSSQPADLDGTFRAARRIVDATGVLRDVARDAALAFERYLAERMAEMGVKVVRDRIVPRDAKH